MFHILLSQPLLKLQYFGIPDALIHDITAAAHGAAKEDVLNPGIISPLYFSVNDGQGQITLALGRISIKHVPLMLGTDPGIFPAFDPPGVNPLAARAAGTVPCCPARIKRLIKRILLVTKIFGQYHLFHVISFC
jgi:hypothetical protein